MQSPVVSPSVVRRSSGTLVVVALTMLMGCSASAPSPSQVANVTPGAEPAPTPLIIYITPEPRAQPTPLIIYVTPEPAASPSQPESSAQPSTPQIGADVLYEASTDDAFAEWISGSDWNVGGSQLLSGGRGDTRCSIASEECDAVSFAPFEPPTGDYVIEAEIQVVKVVGHGICMVCNSPKFGVVVRAAGANALIIGVSYRDKTEAHIIDVDGFNYTSAAHRTYDPKTATHLYRLTVFGNQVTLEIDGKKVLSALDNTAIGPGRIGVVDDGVQVAVKSFQVLSIP